MKTIKLLIYFSAVKLITIHIQKPYFNHVYDYLGLELQYQLMLIVRPESDGRELINLPPEPFEPGL